jgi:ribosome biogenesis GTPase
MKGIVYKSTGSWYAVKTTEGVVLQARIKGRFKIDDITSTNPIAVGDVVELEPEPDSDANAVITGIDARRNYITRTSPHNRHQHHIVASNLDQSLLFATIRQPRTSTGFIDRFLITAEAYHIPAVIVFNKTDMLDGRSAAQLEEMLRIYRGAGYRVETMSLETGEGVGAVMDLLKGKTSLLSGHSGVGKSTFINHIFPELRLKTNEVSGWSGKGLHTTTFAEMFDLPSGGRIIDTPGIRELGLVNISRQELSHYFPEMRALLPECRFNNCLHENEPGCAVKDAVSSGRVDAERYANYLIIAETLDGKKY